MGQVFILDFNFICQKGLFGRLEEARICSITRTWLVNKG